VLKGDEIYYDRARGFGKARGNVSIIGHREQCDDRRRLCRTF
jgi:hypothetical protein